MVTYGYYDNKGEFHETKQKINYLVLSQPPKPVPKRISCVKCQSVLKLHPFERDIPPTHYTCQCRQLTIKERNDVFFTAINETKQTYNLKILQFNKQKRGWALESNEWVTKIDRLDSKRLEFNKQEYIVKYINDLIMYKLQIEFKETSDLLNE